MEIRTAEFVTSMAAYGKFPGKGLPQIAVAGKSNVGKSTLINRLCRRNKLARTSSTPGKTRLLNVFLLNGEFHLVDLPGYGFAKVDKQEQLRWGKMMQDYFAQAEELKHVLCKSFKILESFILSPSIDKALYKHIACAGRLRIRHGDQILEFRF